MSLERRLTTRAAKAKDAGILKKNCLFSGKTVGNEKINLPSVGLCFGEIGLHWPSGKARRQAVAGVQPEISKPIGVIGIIILRYFTDRIRVDVQVPVPAGVREGRSSRRLDT